MKKLAILFIAFALLCSCLALAACGDDGDTSSAAGSSDAGSSSAADSSSTATSSDEASTSAPADESSAATETTTEEPSDAPDESSGAEDPTLADGKLFWLTHYNTLSNEGSGVIMTAEYTGGEWWFHCSFAPVEGEDGVYQIVEVLDGTDGSGHPLAIPDGGFVYALHTGNNYEGGIDYTTQASATLLDDARKWKAGEKFVFSGIDFDNFTKVPTETPDVNWYEDGDNGTGHYVCTATYAKVG